MNELLKLLEDNARLTDEQLARMLDKEVGEIRDMIEQHIAVGGFPDRPHLFHAVADRESRFRRECDDPE